MFFGFSILSLNNLNIQKSKNGKKTPIECANRNKRPPFTKMLLGHKNKKRVNR